MFQRFAILLTLTLAGSRLLPADTILFGLLGDPNQNYTFTRTDTPNPGSEYPNWQVTVPSGPYPSWLGADTPADQGDSFCISFLLTANWGAQYSGTVTMPSTPAQLEAAWLGSVLYGEGGFNANLDTEKGPIAMAIWQLLDPTPGDVPRDPAAQPFVTEAVNLYNSGYLQPNLFPNTKIFVPSNSSIQTFMLDAPAVPEPTTVVLFACGLALIALGRRGRGRSPVVAKTFSEQRTEVERRS